MEKFGLKEAIVSGALLLFPVNSAEAPKQPQAAPRPAERSMEMITVECESFASRIAQLVYEAVLAHTANRRRPDGQPISLQAAELMASMQGQTAFEREFYACVLAGGEKKLHKQRAAKKGKK